ncbi:hypothetical protein [Mycolicibacterium komossense]|uniref:Uncharacterized protein n=1 Tax=Mycolicibacterium komossense TaxID=1779 RepID=A0ABT3CBB1_9MYCO|nr:hypothetical protein [Mycolicibacterium komossense]MCV7226770.1 hypothetical protein [Mycolicibacterium komossense]
MAEPSVVLDRPPRRRRLTQRPAAVALAAGLIAVPGLPMLANELLPEPAWESAEATQQVDVYTAEGHGVVVTAPDGWEAQDNGDSALLRADGSIVAVQVYERSGRDPESVAQRLMRANRIQGISSALDGGTIASVDGTLTGQTCLVVTTDMTGTCAYLMDDDVVVSVISLARPGQPAPPIVDVVGPMMKRDKQ